MPVLLTLLLEFLVRPHGVFIGGHLKAPLAVIKVLKRLDLRCVQATMAFAGGPVERTGPDFRQVSGNSAHRNCAEHDHARACCGDHQQQPQELIPIHPASLQKKPPPPWPMAGASP
jgi:hypothetical protein